MGRRKRNKSSPAQKQSSKKYKFAPLPIADTDSESEGTDYFEAVESDSENTFTDTPPTPSPIMNLTQSDIDHLCSKLAPTLIKSLKNALKEDVLTDLRKELSDIVKAQTQEMREEITHLKDEVKSLRSELKKSHAEHDELAQYGRRMCLDVSGIPGDLGKPDEDVETKILSHTNKLGLDLKSSDIDKCHRKGKFDPKVLNQRKVIVKFTNSKARDRVYNARKTLGNGIFVQENLTPYREYLSYEARQLKRNGLITKTWVSGCRVFVQVAGEPKGRLILSMDDINTIKDK